MPALVKISYASVNADGAQTDADRVRVALGRLSTETRGLGVAGEGSNRGLTAVRRGLSELAFQATGVPGPIGRISEGLLQFGAGHIVVLGAVAGLASVALAIRAMTSPTDTVTKSLEAFTKSLKDSRDAGERLRDILNEIPAAQAKTLGFLQGAQGIINFGSLGDAMANAATFFANRSIAANNVAAGAATDALLKSQVQSQISYLENLRRSVELEGASTRQVAEMRAQWAGLDADGIRRAGDLAVELEAHKQITIQIQAQARAMHDFVVERMQIQSDLRNLTMGPRQFQVVGGLSGALSGDLGVGGIAGGHFLKIPQLTKDFDDALKKVEGSLQSSADAARRAALAHQQAAIQIINAVAGMISLIVSGGSAGGIIAGIGGIIGFVNPVAGAIVSGLGSIIMAADSNQERRHGELLHALEPVGELLFIVAQNGGDAASLDSLVRRMEQATGRRISVRFGGT